LKALNRDEIADLVSGATILGVGGGGDPGEGMKALLAQYNGGRRLVLATLEELGTDDMIASPYFVGSVAPAKRGSTPAAIRDPVADAVELLEGRLGRKIAATVATELGGGNTAASLAIAAKLGIPMVDGDLMGRAGPELHQSTLHVFGFRMTPAALVSESGNRILVDRSAGIDDYEAIARHASVVSGGRLAVVDSPLSVSEAKACVVPLTVSKCMSIGRSRREATERGEDPVGAVADLLDNGRRVFEGRVSKYTWKDERGFLFGECLLEGTGRWAAKTLRSWIQNEHIMCWIDDEPAVMPPDLIIFLDPATGEGITNDKLSVGSNVAVLGSSIARLWRSVKGLSLFGPKRFGFDYEYVPFESLGR
jgi:hypothetical protein